MWGRRRVEYIADCFCGNVRDNNEDNFYCNGVTLPMIHKDLEQFVRGAAWTTEDPLFAICDGMGGEACGEAASFTGVEAIGAERRKVADLTSMIQKMNRNIYEQAQNNGIEFMGSTAAILKMKRGKVLGANIGDSSVFLFRDGELKKLTVDHVTEKHAWRKGELTQYLGVGENEMILEPHLFQVKCRQGDYYLMCTDGVTDMLGQSEIAGIIRESISLEQIISVLKKRIYEAGAKDNTTMICCRID